MNRRPLRPHLVGTSPLSPAAAVIVASLLVACLLVAASTTGCSSEDERLGAMVDACLEREREVKSELAQCEDERAAAVEALEGEPREGRNEPPPVMPVRARVLQRGREPAQLLFRAENESGKAVDEVAFWARLYNAFDEPIHCDTSENEGVPSCRDGSAVYRGRERVEIAPKRSERIERDLSDFDRARKAIVTIYEVSFADGSVWRGTAQGYPAPARRQRANADGGGPEGASPSSLREMMPTPAQPLPLPSIEHLRSPGRSAAHGTNRGGSTSPAH